MIGHGWDNEIQLSLAPTDKHKTELLRKSFFVIETLYYFCRLFQLYFWKFQEVFVSFFKGFKTCGEFWPFFHCKLHLFTDMKNDT